MAPTPKNAPDRSTDVAKSSPPSGVVDLQPKRAPIDWDEATRLHQEEGWTIAQVAERFGYKVRHVRDGIRARRLASPPPPSLPDPNAIRLRNIWLAVRRSFQAAPSAATDIGAAPPVTLEGAWIDYWTFCRFATTHGYEPGMGTYPVDPTRPLTMDNIRFAPRGDAKRKRQEQAPRSTRIQITAFGESKNVYAWLRDPRCSVPGNTLRARIARGIPPELALTTPIGGDLGNDRRERPVVPHKTHIDVEEARRLYIDEKMPVAQIAPRLGFSVSSLYDALRRHGVEMRKVQTGTTATPEGHRLNKVWADMRLRCRRMDREWGTTDSVEIREEWSRFEPFRDWALESGWKPGRPFIRNDRSKPFSPENCRFVTKTRASQKKRVPACGPRLKVLVTAFGETKGLKAWSRDPRCTVTMAGFRRRLVRGWDPEDAVTRPPAHGGFKIDWHRMLIAFGEEKTLARWLADPRCRVTSTCVAYRLARGATVEDALTTPSFRWNDERASADA